MRLRHIMFDKHLRQAKVASLRELQSQTQEELDALLPSAPQRTADVTARSPRSAA